MKSTPSKPEIPQFNPLTSGPLSDYLNNLFALCGPLPIEKIYALFEPATELNAKFLTEDGGETAYGLLNDAESESFNFAEIYQSKTNWNSLDPWYFDRWYIDVRNSRAVQNINARPGTILTWGGVLYCDMNEFGKRLEYYLKP